MRAWYPGRILEMNKIIGDRVQKGEIVARVESSSSLQTYTIPAPMSGRQLALIRYEAKPRLMEIPRAGKRERRPCRAPPKARGRPARRPSCAFGLMCSRVLTDRLAAGLTLPGTRYRRFTALRRHACRPLPAGLYSLL